ncbi:malonate decarboxylase subunit alpha, partial [Erwinia sp. MYb416]
MLTQPSPRIWDTRRREKQRRIASLGLTHKVLPTDDLIAMLEKLIVPGDRVVM